VAGQGVEIVGGKGKGHPDYQGEQNIVSMLRSGQRLGHGEHPTAPKDAGFGRALVGLSHENDHVKRPTGMRYGDCI
jgi:hypothetical protein